MNILIIQLTYIFGKNILNGLLLILRPNNFILFI
jgi:hypothetical protein